MPDWVSHFPASITVIDPDGNIIEMNEKARATYASEGGADLIGKSIYACHKPQSEQRIRDMIDAGGNHVYTIEQDGRKILIYQQAWQRDGEPGGVVEIALDLPPEIPHRVRS